MNDLLLHKNLTIAYDGDDCFKNGEKVVLDPVKPKDEVINQLKKEFFQNFFGQYRENVVVLSAAGTSMDNGANRGKSRVQLWDNCQPEITALSAVSTQIGSHSSVAAKDLEGFLSRVMLYEKLNGEIAGGHRKTIEKKIADACKLSLHGSAPHISFLNKVTARKASSPRVKLFTLNYDTLFEQAANKGGFTVIDGFSYVQPRRFAGRYFDIDFVNRYQTRINKEESFEPKVFHLYKLHGSLTWVRSGNDVVMELKPVDPLIIYPAEEKYESSYEQPYFEMMSRFQQSLRKDETMLIVIGFGFMDKHIQNVIAEAVEQNPSFHLVIVQFNPDDKIDHDQIRAYLNADNTPKENVTVIFDTFSGFTSLYPANKTYMLSTTAS